MRIESDTMDVTNITTNEGGLINYRERTGLSKSEITELADDIHARGLIYPLAVWQTELEGKTKRILIGGNRRRLAILQLKERGEANGVASEVPVRVFSDCSLADAAAAAVADHIHRVDPSSYELARAIADLKAFGHEQKEISVKLNKSQSWVSRVLTAYMNATDAVKKAWKAGTLPDDIIQTVARLPKEKQETELDKLLEVKGTSGKRAGAGKVRLEVKKHKPPVRGDRPALRELKELMSQVAEVRGEKTYLAGMRDALRFVLGDLGWGEFGSEYQTFIAKQNQKEDKSSKD